MLYAFTADVCDLVMMMMMVLMLLVLLLRKRRFVEQVEKGNKRE